MDLAGSDDIEAFVRTEVNARVAGSNDIVVRGKPPSRDRRVAGSGEIKFR
jgi:lipoate-protein ligase A